MFVFFVLDSTKPSLGTPSDGTGALDGVNAEPIDGVKTESPSPTAADSTGPRLDPVSQAVVDNYLGKLPTKRKVCDELLTLLE